MSMESLSCTKCIVFPAEFGRMFEIWCNFKNVKNHRSSINASASFSRRRLNLYWSTKRRRPKRDAHKNKKLKFFKRILCKNTNTVLFIWIHQQTTFLLNKHEYGKRDVVGGITVTCNLRSPPKHRHRMQVLEEFSTLFNQQCGFDRY